MDFRYRCVAADKSGGRCQNLAVSIVVDPASGDTEDRLCDFHFRAGLANPESLSEAPRPDTVLIRFFLGEADSEIVAAIKTLVARHNRSNTLERHIKQARALGRNFHRFKGGGSGSPVFRQAGIDGLRGVALSGLLEELAADSYRLSSVGWFDQGATVFQLAFRRDGDLEVSAPVSEIIRDLAGSSWQQGFVWANPPREDGAVVHTVNLKGARDRAEFAAYELLFVHGDWFVERPAFVGGDS